MKRYQLNNASSAEEIYDLVLLKTWQSAGQVLVRGGGADFVIEAKKIELQKH